MRVQHQVKMLFIALAGLLVFGTPQHGDAAIVVRYVDNRLTTGLNNGSSPANAYQTLEDLRAGSSGTIDQVVFTKSSGPYTEVVSMVATRWVTDLSWDAATRTVNSATTNFVTAGFTPGAIVRVHGSGLNAGQLTVSTVAASSMSFVASNVIMTESAGTRTNIVSLTTGGNRAMLDPGGNATAIRPRRYLFNGVTLDGSLWINNAQGYTWTRSAGNPNEWYVRRSNLSNPSIAPLKSALIDNVYVGDAADLGLDLGTVGALTSSAIMGYGDNDSLGYSTVYVYAPTINPNTMVIRVGQASAVVSTNWQYHSFEDGVFQFGIVGLKNGGDSQWWAKRMVFMYQSDHGVEMGGSAAGAIKVESSLTYFTGHRGYSLSANTRLEVYNCVDYGAHLFLIIGSGASTSSAVAILKNNISMENEAGAIDKKTAASVLTETHNTWYPRFGASGAALGYINTANWTTTHATDFPPSASTTISTVSANVAAGAINPNPPAPLAIPFSIDNIKPSAPQMIGTGTPVFFLRDITGRRYGLSSFDRGSWVTR